MDSGAYFESFRKKEFQRFPWSLFLEMNNSLHYFFAQFSQPTKLILFSVMKRRLYNLPPENQCTTKDKKPVMVSIKVQKLLKTQVFNSTWTSYFWPLNLRTCLVPDPTQVTTPPRGGGRASWGLFWEIVLS